MESKIIIYGFHSGIRGFGKVELGSAEFRTAPEYQVSSLLFSQEESIILEDGPNVTGRAEFPKENELELLKQGEIFFELNKEEFLRLYEGRYIAILNKSIVDVDDVFENLAKRVYRTYGYVTIYMTKVEREQTIFNLPSPTL